MPNVAFNSPIPWLTPSTPAFDAFSGTLGDCIRRGPKKPIRLPRLPFPILVFPADSQTVSGQRIATVCYNDVTNDAGSWEVPTFRIKQFDYHHEANCTMSP